MVDADEFTAFSGRSTVIASSNGSSSLWWYLYVKNVASQISHRPSYVGILFRDAFLTEPGHCVTGEYRKPIRQLITAGEELVDTLSFGGRGATDVYSIMSWAPREARNWLNHKTEKRVEDFCQLRYGQGRPAFRHVFATENMNTELYHESLLQYETIDNVASYDFHDQNGRSYLPEIIRRLNNVV